jgi:hypothetical protein
MLISICFAYGEVKVRSLRLRTPGEREYPTASSSHGNHLLVSDYTEVFR